MFLKTLDFKEEKLQKHQVEVIIFNDCQIQHYFCFSNIELLTYVSGYMFISEHIGRNLVVIDIKAI